MATKQMQRTPSVAAKRNAARKPAATKPNGSVPARKRAAASPVLGTAGSAVKQGIAVSMKGLEKIEVEIAQLVRRTVADSLRAGGSIAKELSDVFIELPVAPWEVAPGATVTVPTPEGAVELGMPPGRAWAGRKLRLKGKGLPSRLVREGALEATGIDPEAWDLRGPTLQPCARRDPPDTRARDEPRAVAPALDLMEEIRQLRAAFVSAYTLLGISSCPMRKG